MFVIQLRSCTTERILTAAMLSDAADEAAMLTRAFDKEATDTARVPEELSMFVHRVRVLFLERQAINHGFTKLMMQQLGQAQSLVLQTFESKVLPASRMSSKQNASVATSKQGLSLLRFRIFRIPWGYDRFV